jgi:hypothetical protein
VLCQEVRIDHRHFKVGMPDDFGHSEDVSARLNRAEDLGSVLASDTLALWYFKVANESRQICSL